jgi:pyruvate-ferredoxin/flavodoxin oxidoreductase
MAHGIEHQRLAVDTAYWPLYRFDPRREAAGEPPLVLDSPPPKADVSKLMAVEARFQLTDQQDHAYYERLVDQARHQIVRRQAMYQELARRARAVGAS